MVEKKRETEQVPNEDVRNAVNDVIKKKPAKPRKRRRLHNLEEAESIEEAESQIISDIENARRNGLTTFEILVATDANKLKLFDFIERMATSLKADGQISAFRWNNRRKKNSTGVIVDIVANPNIPTE